MKLSVCLLLLLVSSGFAQPPAAGPVFDRAGHMTGYLYPDGKKEIYRYDSSWRMISFRDRDGKLSHFHYVDAASRNSPAPSASKAR